MYSALALRHCVNSCIECEPHNSYSEIPQKLFSAFYCTVFSKIEFQLDSIRSKVGKSRSKRTSSSTEIPQRQEKMLLRHMEKRYANRQHRLLFFVLILSLWLGTLLEVSAYLSSSGSPSIRVHDHRQQAHQQYHIGNGEQQRRLPSLNLLPSQSIHSASTKKYGRSPAVLFGSQQIALGSSYADRRQQQQQQQQRRQRGIWQHHRSGSASIRRGRACSRIVCIESDETARDDNLSSIFRKLKEMEGVKERSRKLRRTVFASNDWRIHRSSNRYFKELRSMPRSFVLRGLANQAMSVSLVSAILVLYNLFAERRFYGIPFPVFSVPPLPFTLTSSSLGLLLVFRTNASYSRWNEARIAWASIAAKTFDLMRQSTTWLDREPTKRLLIRHIVAFARCLKWQLGDVDKLHRLQDDLRTVLTPEEIESVLAVASSSKLSAPQKQLLTITQLISKEVRETNMPVNVRSQMDKIVTELSAATAVCERIFTTPIPLIYTRHTARFLVLWLSTVPMALYEMLPLGKKWMVPMITFLNSIFLFGIEDLGVQIEEPFSILPLAMICKKIQRAGKGVLAEAGLEWWSVEEEEERKRLADLASGATSIEDANNNNNNNSSRYNSGGSRVHPNSPHSPHNSLNPGIAPSVSGSVSDSSTEKSKGNNSKGLPAGPAAVQDAMRSLNAGMSAGMRSSSRSSDNNFSSVSGVSAVGVDADAGDFFPDTSSLNQPPKQRELISASPAGSAPSAVSNSSSSVLIAPTIAASAVAVAAAAAAVKAAEGLR